MRDFPTRPGWTVWRKRDLKTRRECSVSTIWSRINLRREVGENFFANYNLTILDVGKVKIGANAQIAPNVSIYTAGHPVHPESRNTGYEYGIPITIGDNVWIGGSVTILPGVTIGNNVVIGAGSVVTRDLPDNVIAAGNPCRVLRTITEEDRDFYYRDRKFDVDDYK